MDSIKLSGLKKSSNKWQFTRNLSVNSLNFIVNVSLGLVLTPFLINHLGVALFGVIQIAISLSTYMGMITSSLNQANNRYISLYITNNKKEAANSVITTTLLIYLFVFFVLLPVLLYLSINATSIFNIPVANKQPVSLLFIFITFSFMLIMVTSVLVSPAYARNRLDIVQLVNIVRNIFKLGFVVLFVLYVSKSPSVVGLGHFLAGIISASIAILVFNRYMPFYRFRLANFKKEYAKDLVSLSGWTLVNTIGLLLFRQTDIIIVNYFLGAEASGRFAIMVQIYSVLIHIATVFSVVFSPIIFLKYSQGKIDELKQFVFKAVKYTGILISFASALVVVYSAEILDFWVGNEYTDLTLFLQLMIIHFSVTQATRPLLALNIAFNRVKVPGLLNLLSGFLHIIVSIILLAFTNFEFFGIILSSLVFSVFSKVVVLQIYASHYLKVPLTKVLQPLIAPLLLQFIVIVVGFALKHFIEIVNLSDFVILVFINVVLGLFFMYYVLLSKSELKMIKSLLKR